MNKHVRIFLLIIALCYAAAFPLYLLSGDTAINWTAIMIAVGAVVVIIFAHTAVSMMVYRKINSSFQKNEYERVLALGRGFNKWNINGELRQNVYISMAVVYLKLCDEVKFEEYIVRVRRGELISVRYYWEAMRCLIGGDYDTAALMYKKFKETEEQMHKTYPRRQYAELLEWLFAHVENNKDADLDDLRGLLF